MQVSRIRHPRGARRRENSCARCGQQSPDCRRFPRSVGIAGKIISTGLERSGGAGLANGLSTSGVSRAGGGKGAVGGGLACAAAVVVSAQNCLCRNRLMADQPTKNQTNMKKQFYLFTAI